MTPNEASETILSLYREGRHLELSSLELADIALTLAMYYESTNWDSREVEILQENSSLTPEEVNKQLQEAAENATQTNP